MRSVSRVFVRGAQNHRSPGSMEATSADGHCGDKIPLYAHRSDLMHRLAQERSDSSTATKLIPRSYSQIEIDYGRGRHGKWLLPPLVNAEERWDNRDLPYGLHENYHDLCALVDANTFRLLAFPVDSNRTTRCDHGGRGWRHCCRACFNFVRQQRGRRMPAVIHVRAPSIAITSVLHQYVRL